MDKKTNKNKALHIEIEVLCKWTVYIVYTLTEGQVHTGNGFGYKSAFNLNNDFVLTNKEYGTICALLYTTNAKQFIKKMSMSR